MGKNRDCYQKDNFSTKAKNEETMTHDELLAKINPDWDEYVDNSKFREALRAVVELARKLQDDDPFHEDAGWNAGYNHAMYEVIQAIQEQLK